MSKYFNKFSATILLVIFIILLSLTISLEEIREYTVKEKRIINITRSIVAENLLKYFDIKTN